MKAVILGWKRVNCRADVKTFLTSTGRFRIQEKNIVKHEMAERIIIIVFIIARNNVQ